MMKKQRQNRILELVRSHRFETQDELLDILLLEGFRVTQATISRDLRELNLVKRMTGAGAYRYSLPYEKETAPTPQFNSSLTDSVRELTHACNIVVVKTLPGMAQALAACIDNLDTGEIIGCVAGDDTILMVAGSDELAAVFCQKLRKILRVPG